MHFTEEQKMLREMIRDFAQNRIKPAAAEIDENERFPEEIIAEMAELGLMGIPYPESPITRDAFLELARKLTVRDENGRVKHYGFIFRRDIHWLDLVRQ